MTKKSEDALMASGRRIVRSRQGAILIPITADALERCARRNGWGVVFETTTDSYGPCVFISVGRNPGVVADSKRATRGVLYRLRWDTVPSDGKSLSLASVYTRSTDTVSADFPFGKWQVATTSVRAIMLEMDNNEVDPNSWQAKGDVA